MTGEATHADFVIVGGGLAGLAAAMDLEDRAIVLERAARPGGLVRADNREGYWFDHVLHLLYCPDPATQARVESLMDGVLAPCPPDAWVETLAG
ncbi:MAG: NAD(P)-binding protein, partial [bacterium]